MGADLYRETKNPETGTWESGPARAEADRLYDVYMAAVAKHPQDSPDVEAARKAWLDAFDKANTDDWYFRDSYNDSSLFWMLDLSWWNDLFQYLGPNGDGVMESCMIDGEGPYPDCRLHPAGCLRLADELGRRAELLVANCRKQGLPAEAADPTRLDIRYYDEKLARLIRFLRSTAEAGDTIACSV